MLLERFECGDLLKVLLSTKCSYDCKYCPNAWQKGASVEPKELASFVIKRNVRKVFVSSAVSGEVEKVMEKIELAGKLLRNHVDYLHLKIMPHASRESIERIVEIADRVSLNFESPRSDILSEISSFKDFHSFMRQQRTIAKLAKRHGKSFTTQIIVGLGESDYEALKFAEKMYELGAARVYYSPFTPVEGTPMEKCQAESKKRAARLYRADALIRLYGVPAKKLRKIMVDDFLPRKDPKVLLAERFGVERIEDMPGISYKAAKLLKFVEPRDLKKLGFRGKLSAFVEEQMRLSDFYALR